MMIPTSGGTTGGDGGALLLEAGCFFAIRVAEELLPSRLDSGVHSRADILRGFLPRRDLRALLPVRAKLSDQIERSGDEHGVASGGLRQSII